MSYTDTTENLGLPIYVASDKPSYLGDWNETMEKLDTGYGTVETIQSNVEALETAVQGANEKAEAAQSAAVAAQRAAEAAQSTADTGVSNAAQASADATAAKAYAVQLARQSHVRTGGADIYAITDLGSNVTDDEATSPTECFRIVFNRGTQEAKFIGSLTIGTQNMVSGSTLANSMPLIPDGTFWLKDFCTATDPSGKVTFVDCTYTDDGKIRTQGSIPANSKVSVNMHYSTTFYGGDFRISPILPAQAATAAATFKSWQGTIEYSNSVLHRMDVSTTHKGDCSGSIASAFKAIGVVIPNYATTQAGFGTIVALAEKNQPLDVSETQAGDILCYSDDSWQTVHHVALFTGSGEAYEVDTAYDNSQTLGPQPLNDPATSLMSKDARMIVRYADSTTM